MNRRIMAECSSVYLVEYNVEQSGCTPTGDNNFTPSYNQCKHRSLFGLNFVRFENLNERLLLRPHCTHTEVTSNTTRSKTRADILCRWRSCHRRYNFLNREFTYRYTGSASTLHTTTFLPTTP